ncbi:MAG: hypothetical protein KGQ66_18395 [Acidobacteriota bacterium]|nr:hypothetical protein [Acidobacteriota bacterium]
MGLFRAWKGLKAVAADGLPDSVGRGRPDAAVGRGRPDAGRPSGAMMVGLIAAMAKMMGPAMLVQAPQRGGPLPGTVDDVLAPQDGSARAGGIAALGERDRAFDASSFIAFAGQVFAAHCSMWGTGDTTSMRPLLADDLWEPLAAALGSGFATGGAAIYSHQRGVPDLAGVWADRFYDSALVSFSVDVDLPYDHSKPLPAGILATEWTEDWLFQRSVTPGGDPMIGADPCPTCGSPRQVDGAGRCQRCRQPVPVLTSGWLVSAVRNHNPTVQAVVDQFVAGLREHPATLAMLPDDIVKLLPPGEVAAVDPSRAAALGLRGI